jgi:hypothetical protein
MSQLGLWINLYNEKNHGYEYSSYEYSLFPILSIPGELIVCSFAGLSERNIYAWSLGGLIVSTINGFLHTFIVVAVYRFVETIRFIALYDENNK